MTKVILSLDEFSFGLVPCLLVEGKPHHLTPKEFSDLAKEVMWAAGVLSGQLTLPETATTVKGNEDAQVH